MRSITFTDLSLTLALWSGAVVFGAAALAQEGPDAGCYSRTYSQAHLDAHPDQVARSLSLWVYDQSFEGEMNRLAYLVVQFADQGHVHRDGHGAVRRDQSLMCFTMEEGRPGCAVECDGGSFWVTQDTGDTLTIATEYLMVGETEGCGGAVDLAERPGHIVKYRLNKVNEAECLGLVEN